MKAKTGRDDQNQPPVGASPNAAIPKAPAASPHNSVRRPPNLETIGLTSTP